MSMDQHEDVSSEVNAGLSSAEQNASKCDGHVLHTTSCTFSQGGKYHSHSLKKASPCPEVRWDAHSVTLVDKSSSSSWSLQWNQITGIWTTVETVEEQCLMLSVTFETCYGSELTFLRFKADMNHVAGQFLADVQGARQMKLKRGAPPTLVMSWMAHLIFYSWPQPANSNRLRVAFGWTSVLFEVVYAFALFVELPKLLMSRQSKLMHAVAATSSATDMVKLIPYLFVLIFTIRSLLSTIKAVFLSVRTFWRAHKKS